MLVAATQVEEVWCCRLVLARVLQLVSVVLCLSAVAALREARVSYLWVLLQLLWVKVELCPLKVVRPTPVNLAV